MTTTATDVEMKNDNDNINDHPNDIVWCEGGVVTFREGGHHSGEAHTMDDMIVDGYNDGWGIELSARCELIVYLRIH